MSKPLISSKYTILEPLLLSLMIIIGIAIGYKINDTEDDFSLISRLDNSTAPIGRIEEVLRFIENKYVDSLNVSQIENDLINEVLKKLDPHSIYIPPSQLKDINLQMSGKYLGIGIETISLNDTFYVTQILEESPAKAVGISVGDKLISINDTIVAGKELDIGDLSKLISEGEELVLTLQSGNIEKTVELQAKELEVSATKVHFKSNEQTGYIRLDRFTSKSYADFMLSIENLVSDRTLNNLIIDLRDNPGGYLPETTKILCQLFKEKDRLLVYTEGENSAKQDYKTTGKTFFDVRNIAVLINEGSASGSEILAGAIQDWDRGVVIGERSYGKGLVQEQYDLRNGGAIRLTVAKYYTPSGRLIQRDYDDKEDYFKEVADRRISGEHFEKTSKSDSTMFYETRILKRKVLGGGGIKPDVEIVQDDINVSDEYYSLTEEIRSSLYKAFFEGKFQFSKAEFPLNEAQLEEAKFILNKNASISGELIVDNQQKFEQDINIILAQANHGNVFGSKVASLYDETILEALKSFKTESIFAEYID